MKIIPWVSVSMETWECIISMETLKISPSVITKSLHNPYGDPQNLSFIQYMICCNCKLRVKEKWQEEDEKDNPLLSLVKI